MTCSLPRCYIYRDSTAVEEKQDGFGEKRKIKAIPEYMLKHFKEEHPKWAEKFERPAAEGLR